MKIQLKSEGVKESDIKTLDRNTTDPEGRLGFIEGAEFALRNREFMTLDIFKEHYKDTLKQIGNRKHDSYESSLLYALRLNIEELEKEGE